MTTYKPGDYFPIYWLDARPYGGELGYCIGPLSNDKLEAHTTPRTF